MIPPLPGRHTCPRSFGSFRSRASNPPRL